MAPRVSRAPGTVFVIYEHKLMISVSFEYLEVMVGF